MKKLLFLLFFPCMLFAQETRLGGNEKIQAAEIQALPDRNYTIEQVAGDSSVIFQKDLTLKDYDTNTAYWIKSTLTHTADRYAEYYLSAFPFLDNTYYYFDQKQDKWIALKGGLAAKDAVGRTGMIKMGFYPNQTTSLYVKMNLGKFSGQSNQITASLKTVKTEEVEKKMQQTYMYWLITAVAIGLFFIFNSYVYLMFRDRAYLYYLATLVSGLVYITSISEQVHRFVPIRFFRAQICDEGIFCYFNFNSFVLSISIVLIAGFLVAFTREFLQTRIILPKWDRFLKYTSYAFLSYIVFSSVATYSGLLYMKGFGYMLAENIIIALVFCFLIASGIMAHRKKFRPAKYFLIANSVQLITIISLAVYLMINKNYGNSAVFLPHIVLLIQALTFAISLVARVNLLKEELRVKKEESILLQSHNEQMILHNKLMELERQKLQEEADFKNRQLATTTMHLYNKNEILSELQTQIKKIPKSEAPDTVISQIKSAINNNIYIDADWEKFKLHFEQVHPDFFKKLEKNHPDLTPYEIRLCAYLHIQLSGKEIATLLNIEPASVRKAKMRLKKKMNTDLV